jgi:hypothetical protein
MDHSWYGALGSCGKKPPGSRLSEAEFLAYLAGIVAKKEGICSEKVEEHRVSMLISRGTGADDWIARFKESEEEKWLRTVPLRKPKKIKMKPTVEIRTSLQNDILLKTMTSDTSTQTEKPCTPSKVEGASYAEGSTSKTLTAREAKVDLPTASDTAPAIANEAVQTKGAVHSQSGEVKASVAAMNKTD